MLHRPKVFFFFTLTSLILLTSCSQKISPSEVKSTHENFKSATVIYNNLDGCNWMILLQDGKKLEPVNLTNEFRKENLKIWIRYEIKKGVSICMSGQPVTILEIELRKDE